MRRSKEWSKEWSNSNVAAELIEEGVRYLLAGAVMPLTLVKEER